ncbi:acyltransferase family protein [Pararhizobium haloflavum]|uniref:acyltransferase family protein n=1 Tax=Pararhizobium haloflavum TaxID=2037914 RepID=UPI000C18C8BB|nr:acyltransferase [Pararhizobium haloflavum]
MQSKNVSYIPRLDHLRLLAALLVVCFHFFHFYLGGWQPLPQWFFLAPVTEGHTGVALFFVLSGFIFMTIALGGETIAYRRFMANRVLRIAPLFLTIFVLAISINRDGFEAADIFYVLFTNIGSPPTSAHFATGAAWSISIEFTFYLIFPFLALFVRSEGAAYILRLLAILAVVKLGAYLATPNSTHMLYSTLVGRLDQFLIGMLAALLYRRHGQWIADRGMVGLILATAAAWTALMVQARFASFFSDQPKQLFWIWWSMAEASVWAGFTVFYLAIGLKLPTRIDQWLATAGQWSFSIYMWHGLIIFGFHRLLVGDLPAGFVASLVQFPLVLAAILAFSWLSYVTIEKPFLDLRRRYVAKTANAAPQAA